MSETKHKKGQADHASKAKAQAHADDKARQDNNTADDAKRKTAAESTSTEPNKDGGILGKAKDALGGVGDFFGNLFKDHKGGIFGALGLGVIGFMLGGPIGALIGGLLGMFMGGALGDNKGQQGAEHGGVGGLGRKGMQRGGQGRSLNRDDCFGITKAGKVVEYGTQSSDVDMVVYGKHVKGKDGQMSFHTDAVALADSHGQFPRDANGTLIFAKENYHTTLPMTGTGQSLSVDENSGKFHALKDEAPKGVDRDAYRNLEAPQQNQPRGHGRLRDPNGQRNLIGSAFMGGGQSQSNNVSEGSRSGQVVYNIVNNYYGTKITGGDHVPDGTAVQPSQFGAGPVGGPSNDRG